MKYVFAVLLVLSLPLARVGAQGLHGRIFILEDSSYSRLHRYYVDSLLTSTFNGRIDSGSILPNDLATYDALLVFDYSVTPDTLSFSDQIKIINYIIGGGKFYAEGFPFLRPWSGNPFSDTLWNFLGDNIEYCEAVQVMWDTIHGADSEFTNGIKIPLTPEAESSPCYLFRSMQPVMWAHEPGGADDALAWIPSNHTLVAVLGSSIVPNIFYISLLCNYFGLCADVVTETPNLSGDITVRAIANGPETLLDISSREPSMLEVSNVLGGTVYRQLLTSGETKAKLPASLLNGIYFARVESQHGAAICSFAIVSK